MSTLNLSTNGPSISKSYQTVVQSSQPSGSAASSPTYGQWALYSVSAPLVNAFQQDSAGKESVLKVQSTGEGELVDLIEDFSDGRIQFAFVKVKDPNSGLPKSVLIGWCGEGVPERTKGYFTSHLAAVAKVLHGYHVQITARSDRDLTPEGIIRKVSESSGANYSGGPATKSAGGAAPPPPLATKPAFNPTRSGGGAGGFNPLSSRRAGGGSSNRNVDADGWGDDAPPVTRTQLEKVQPAYKPTKVNIKELASQKEEPPRLNASRNENGSGQPDVVKGAYQPVGKVDIAALRRQAKETESKLDDRPTAVKGAYEPVGKVDIAAIRARAQPPAAEKATSVDKDTSRPSVGSTNQSSERLTSLPRPKVGSMSSSSSAFRGTKPPAPGGLGASAPPAAAAPVGAIGRTFADQGGKTPAQLWAEKKAREGGMGNAPSTNNTGTTSPMASQKSGGGGEWKSGYSGKSWAPVQTTQTGRSAESGGDQRQDEQSQDEERPVSSGGVGALRDRFKAPSPGQACEQPSSPPPLDTSTNPNVGGWKDSAVALPGLPVRPIPQRHETEAEEEDREPERAEEPEQHEESHRMPTPPAVPRSPTPPTPQPSSPIRVAMPVSRSKQPELEAPEERYSPPAIPAESTAKVVPNEEDLTDEPLAHDPARAAGEAAAVATFGEEAADHSTQNVNSGGKKALIQYDYEKAEGNEIDLVEGEYVTNIEMVDADWWMGQNSKGETGLFPSNYVELVEDDEGGGGAPQEEELGHGQEPEAAPASAGEETGQEQGPMATALYDYEAAEPNELSFAEGAKITMIEFPDEDWWFGHHGGHEGLFPANYVQLDE